LPLAWAEVVPFWFISEAYKSAGLLPPKAIPIGIPTRRGTTPTSVFIPELLKLGGDIWSFIKEQKDLRIAFVVSCDLSHYHSKDPTSPYEFNEDAVPFDNFCVDWAQLDLSLEEVDGSNEKLLDEGGGSLADHIGSCGYTGLVILQGVLTSCVKDPVEGKTFKANFLEYSWPTYYGMMVNHFLAN
jgi:aromatic ring-opening dioxygenase LigB subunit